MKKEYIVHLTEAQRDFLERLLHKGKHSSRKLNRARILLLCHQQKEDKEVAQLVGVRVQTVYNIRKRFVNEGFDAALHEKARRGAPIKLNDKAEAYAIAFACSDAPEGRDHWTMQMIADKLIELKVLESISDETIRLRFKKKR